MALTHAQALEVIDIRPLGTALREAVTISLLKTEHLQLMRLVLPAGRSVPQHHVAGEITVQCLEGEVTLDVPSRSIELAAGQLVLLPAGEPHALRARTDATALVTVLLHA